MDPIQQATDRVLLVCKSVHHGNTERVAERIGAVLDATVEDPDDQPIADSFPDLIGIGSGIYYGRFHKSIRRWLKRLNPGAGTGKQAFVFSTSGLPFLAPLYHYPLKRALQAKGFTVVAEFACRGHDSFGPLWLIGGLNRKHPNERDLLRAEAFAEQLANTPTYRARK